MTFILFILIFGVVVISHEFGHYLIAKANGIHVVEFAIGMGPTLFSWKKKETKYSVKLLPLGGACMFEGEDGLNTQEGENTEGSFLHAKVWARISTVLAGPIFNFILGGIIAVILAGILVICVVDELCCRKKLHLPTMIQHQQNAARYLVFYMLIVAIFIFGMYGPGYHAEQFIYMQF